MGSIAKVILIGMILGGLGCSKKEQKITLAINPWPGYEVLYLAEQKGFLDQAGLNIKLFQLTSLADSQRSFINGRVDGFTSTLIESVQAHYHGDRPLKIVMLPDYSNGGDVIIARKDIGLESIKGKKVGCEINSLGIFFLYKALKAQGLTLNDVNVVNVEQLSGEEALERGKIDVFVSYPPASIDILASDRYHTIFTSADIPGQIIDALSVRSSLLKEQPDFTKKIHQAWEQAMDYIEKHPDEAYAIMAQRENLTVEEFKSALMDLKLMRSKEQLGLMRDPAQLATNLISVCNVLNTINKTQFNCTNAKEMIGH